MLAVDNNDGDDVVSNVLVPSSSSPLPPSLSSSS